MTTRQLYQRELEKLHKEMGRMVELVGTAIERSIEALKSHDTALAKRIIQDDDIIDTQEQIIERHCVDLIARQSPLASDLRYITMTLKATTDLERIADHASDIAEITLEMGNEKHIKPLVDIPKMADAAHNMVNTAIRAFIRQDMDMAMEVCKSDDVVDDIFARIITELTGIMKDHPETVDQAIKLMFISKYLERMADHATNIGEWVVYMVTGEHKHLTHTLED